MRQTNLYFFKKRNLRKRWIIRVRRLARAFFARFPKGNVFSVEKSREYRRYMQIGWAGFRPICARISFFAAIQLDFWRIIVQKRRGLATRNYSTGCWQTREASFLTTLKYRLYSCDFSTENTFPFGKLAKNALANLRTRYIQRVLLLNRFTIIIADFYGILQFFRDFSKK